MAVGQFYRRFPQLEDDDVIALLAAAQTPMPEERTPPEAGR